MNFFKNLPKNAMRVGKGTAGAYASDFIAEKLVTKIPKVGEKPILKHLLTSGIAIMAMDVKMLDDFAFGAAVNQATNAGYTIPAIKNFMGISDDLSDDVLSEIDENIQDEIALYKKSLSGSESPVSDEPTYGIEEEFSY